MLETVDVGAQSIGIYEASVGAKVVARLRDLAAPLRGVRVLHLSKLELLGRVLLERESLDGTELDRLLKQAHAANGTGAVRGRSGHIRRPEDSGGFAVVLRLRPNAGHRLVLLAREEGARLWRT